MTGTVVVKATGSAYPDNQINYNAEGKRQESQLLRQGSILRGQQVAQGSTLGKEGKVLIGSGFVRTTSGGAQSVALNRFYPETITIHKGQTVTWTANDPVTPHTVTFGAEPGDPFTPVGLDGPGHATLTTPYPTRFVGPTVHSGPLGQGHLGPITFAPSFAVTFNAAGTYQYYCALHDDLGMVGTVNVVP
jgi:plastocyanin